MTRNALKGRLILFLVLVIPIFALCSFFHGDTDKETVTYGTGSRAWTDVQFEDFSSDFENAGSF